MKKRLFTLLLLPLLLAGCGTSAGSQGIYYPALSHQFLKESFALSSHRSGCYVDFSKLSYNGEVYARTQLYKENIKTDLPLDTLLGKELCTVYGNLRYHWSDNKEALADCTHTGTLYRIAGFDQDFRVGLYFEEPADAGSGQETTHYLYIFERTNNITLHTGKDYYTDLFQFPENAALNNLDMNDEEVAAFVDALLEAEFTDPSGEDVPAFDFTTTEDIYYISFTDSLGITNTMELYENGYVVNKKDYPFILKLDPALCQTIIDKIHTPEWSGSYLYNTYAYDKDTNIRTQYYYHLDVTEANNGLTFDLSVQESHTPLTERGQTTVYDGPSGSVSFFKEEVASKHLLSFSLQPLSKDAPQSLTYIEMKKGLQENTVYLRFADSEEELANKEFITLKKQ